MCYEVTTNTELGNTDSQLLEEMWGKIPESLITMFLLTNQHITLFNMFLFKVSLSVLFYWFITFELTAKSLMSEQSLSHKAYIFSIKYFTAFLHLGTQDSTTCVGHFKKEKCQEIAQKCKKHGRK